MTTKMFTLESATREQLLKRMSELAHEKELAWDTYAASRLHDDFAKWSELDDSIATVRAELDARFLG